MRHLYTQLLNDETGFIVSAELILIATIGVLSLVVGLTEISVAINEELEDVACAFGAINQSFCFRGLAGCNGHVAGSRFHDNVDSCDCDSIMFVAPTGECGGIGTGSGD